MIKFINYFIQSLVIYTLFLICRILGLRISRKLFAAFFSLVGPLFKSKTIIYKNLNIVSEMYPDIDKEKIFRGMWKNYGMTFVEYIFLGYFRKNTSHVKINDNGNLSKINKEKKPVIFISGHFANFELMSMEITKKNIPLAAIYRPLNNIFLNPLMEFLRRKYVCKNQIKKGIKGVRKVLNYLEKKTCVALMIDQRLSEGEKINFFNKSALTTTLPAQLSIKYNIDIIPVFIKRNLDNNFEIVFQNRISPNNFKDKLELSEHLNRVLEKMIIQCPHQWIWTHNRWK
jgi:KDO2-lipid IV(A) lauroyltransferase